MRTILAAFALATLLIGCAGGGTTASTQGSGTTGGTHYELRVVGSPHTLGTMIYGDYCEVKLFLVTGTGETVVPNPLWEVDSHVGGPLLNDSTEEGIAVYTQRPGPCTGIIRALNPNNGGLLAQANFTVSPGATYTARVHVKKNGQPVFAAWIGWRLNNGGLIGVQFHNTDANGDAVAELPCEAMNGGHLYLYNYGHENWATVNGVMVDMQAGPAFVPMTPANQGEIQDIFVDLIPN